MTETEAQNFFNEVIKGFWPEWEPTDAQCSLWARKLRRFQYSKAKEAFENWFCEAQRTYKSPPLNNVLKYLSAKKAWDRGILQPEPVKVFELFDQEKPRRKMAFYESSLAALKKRKPHEIEQEAEIRRHGCNAMYSSNWVLCKDWMQYFEGIPI